MIAWLASAADRAALGGIAAPIVLGLYLELAAALRRGYDKSRDTMSSLGDGVDVAAFVFLIVNVGVGVLLGCFAWFVVRPEFGWIWWLVGATAIGSAVIAFTPGHQYCRFPGLYGTPSRQLHIVHLVVAFGNVVIMGALPVLVWAFDRGWRTDPFRTVNNVIAVVFPVAVVGFAITGVRGRRQLRERLILTPKRQHDVLPEPWQEPPRWLDRWGYGERVLFVVGYCWVVAVGLTMLWPDDGWVTVAGTIGYASVATAATFWPQRAVPQVRFSVQSCQRNTVYGADGKWYGEFRFLQVTRVDLFRESLSELLAKRSFLAERPLDAKVKEQPGYTLTFGFTRDGLAELGVDYRWASERPDVFAEGMWDRRTTLGDDPHEWDSEWRSVHVGIWAMARRGRLDEACADMDSIKGVAPVMHPIRVRKGGVGDIELLQFKDGISQPWMRGVPVRRDKPRGGGKIAMWGRWQPLALGEFVLGQVDEANDIFPVPDPAPLFLGGTFAAVRKIEIDNDRLRTLVADLESQPEGGDRTVLARLIGRDQEGTPLVRNGEKGNNRFRYGDDPYGLQCPITAHVRRANPRDSQGFDGLLSNRRRMLRRGMPYVASESDRLAGLMFVSLQARLDDQFEFVQSQWLNDGAAFGLGRDPDALAGHWTGQRQVVLPTSEAPLLCTLPGPIAVARGGAYLFVPSIRGLWYLARGVGPNPTRRSATAPEPARQRDRDPTHVPA